MNSPSTVSKGRSKIRHGAVTVLAYLHETDASCREVATDTELAESSTYRWLTELEEAGILEGEATRPDDGRAVVVYHLPDDELGAAAQVISDRLGTPATTD